jgi:hypothetical protein
MLNLESKTITAKGSPQAVYNYLSDFRNFAHVLPAEQMQDLEVTQDMLKFGISGMGNIGFKITEKVPFESIVMNSTEGSLADFTLKIHIQPAADNLSTLKILLEARMNLFMEMMAKSPLEHLLEMIAERISTMEFQ